jgi:hypothetical protein
MNVCCTAKSGQEPRQGPTPRQQGSVGGPRAMDPEFWIYVSQLWKWRGHVPPKRWHSLSLKKKYSNTTHTNTTLIITTENNNLLR